MNPQVVEMVLWYLKSNGFDGLYNSEAECGCKLDDLAPCGEMSEKCAAGFLHPVGCQCEVCADGEDTWHICNDKKPAQEVPHDGKMEAALRRFDEDWREAHGLLPAHDTRRLVRHAIERAVGRRT